MPKRTKKLKKKNQLDDGDGIAETMLINNVKYHHSCSKKMSKDKLVKAKPWSAKRKATETTQSISPIKKIRPKTHCCQKPLNPYASSNIFLLILKTVLGQQIPQILRLTTDQTLKKLSELIHNCAQTLQHSSCLAKLANSDMYALYEFTIFLVFTALYNEQHASEEQQQSEIDPKEAQCDYNYMCAESIALAELVSYVEVSRE